MSKDAALDLLAAVRAALIASTPVQSRVSGRIFSSWGNQEAPTPFIRMSIPTTRQFEMDVGGEGSETSFSVHVFTTEDAPIVCRQIASAVRDAIERQPLALANSDLVGIDYRDTIQTADGESPSLQVAVVRFVAMTTTK